MPLGQITGELFGHLGRLVSHFIFDLLLEIVVKGVGYFICRLFSKSVDPDGVMVLVTGILAWILIAAVTFLGYSVVRENLFIDSCLDSGGRYDYKNKECISSDLTIIKVPSKHIALRMVDNSDFV